MKVALLNPCFWPEVRRGAERVARDLADGLIERGHHPRLVTSHPGPPSRRVEDGLPVTRHWRPPEGRLRRRRYQPYMTHVPFTYASLRLGDDDLAQALYVTDAQAAARWTRATGRPSVFAYMGVPDHRDLTTYRRGIALMEGAVRGCSAVTALSEVARDAFWRWLGVEARVIHPGVDLDAFVPGPERAEEPTVFFGADPAEPRKRLGLLLEAMRVVRRERPRARLMVSRPRDGALAGELERSGAELADVDERPALAKAYATSWVSCLPSVGEAFGLVLAEALACGTPVVATDHGGMREVVGDRREIGRLFAGERPEDLAAALLAAFELAGDPGTAGACRRRAEDFSLDRCVERHLELYGELIGGAN